ncbi:hypothetical protein TVAG_005720 [Trichomonas vaginalis G3]|uniref:Uncharacterized protein n=1 Tax=Trichomonas vaginalis (strain ATCC PRA-98 / G3) TaxID=412133 RepID=A2FHQ7_TRIV3|nr:hypothetical protein TVAGG3_0554380 [Trichomonas vaginalis G3]EAX95557.1 hypothetical protein TVAG_005720 [Trichomonas vaginalis G3]KAI5520759.1 hypothetical protein TVAGG3_0554380 [Trichomonas vaginalis G3]|eukprot:XP_001308487.1 hypothetical protein [Trichomonas vaginalis G3]
MIEFEEDNNVSQAILDQAKAQAEEQARSKQQIQMPNEIEGIDKEGLEQTEYLLIQEYLQSIGLVTAPEVLRYESLHPTIKEDRRTLAQRLKLRSYDKTPLLVQLIAQRLEQLERQDKANQ